MQKIIETVSVTRGLLVEVPKALLWTFPRAFVIGTALGFFAPIPLLFGLNIDWKITL